MTMTAFLPFDRKPQKTIASMLCKYSNMVAKPTTGAEWMFQGPVKGGRGAMIVQIVDFRDFMITSEREWADEVGWTSNWGIAISVSHKRRTNEEYAFWHAFTVVMMNAYEGNGLASNEVWLSSDEDGFPTTPFTIEELLPDVISSQAEDVMPAVEGAFEEEASEVVGYVDEVIEAEERLPPPPRMRQPATPEPRLVRRPLKSEEEEAPEEEEEAPEEEEEAPKLRLVSFDEEEETDEQESDDDEEDEWWDDDEEDEWEEEESPDEDENEEEEISDAITDW